MLRFVIYGSIDVDKNAVFLLVTLKPNTYRNRRAMNAMIRIFGFLTI